jgi:hypothetical protein
MLQHQANNTNHNTGTILLNTHRMKRLLFIVLVFAGFYTRAQQVNQDTLLERELPTFITEAKRDPDYEKKYQKLVRDVKKVLPYAKVAGFRYQLMEQNLQMLPTEKARKEYLKRTEEAIKDQFMDDLVNMTVSQGKLLIKLIHRETGKDAYALIKDYRGNLSAIYWQTLAKVFTADLRNEYNPVEDWQIEKIIKDLGLE